MLRFVPLHHVRANLRFRELAHGTPQQRLFLGGTEVH
jgi:hypothetical protein